MSNPRAEQYWRDHETEPVQPAPELVVEILRRGESVEAIADKLDDYRSVDVQECWAVKLTQVPLGQQLERQQFTVFRW